MRKQHNLRLVAKALICGTLLMATGGVLFAQDTESDRRLPWPESPYRSFGPAQPLSPDVLLSDEANDLDLRESLSEQIARLSAELFGEQGWQRPFAEGDPLRIFVARRGAEGVRRLVARSLDRRHLVRPTIQIDGSNLSNAEIVRETARLFALAAISSYGVPDRGFLTTAAAELLSGWGDSAEAAEAARMVAAAPWVSLSDHARTMGGAFLEEFVRSSGGRAALRAVWERASERGEDPLTSLVRTYAERTGEAEESLLLRFAARLYTTFETEPGPSNIGLYDLEAGALDAAAPAAWSFRHRTFLPGETASALRFRWPVGAGAGAAVVRYRDPELPPDVVFLAPESVHTVSLSGVARVEWVVAGAAVPGPAAPAFFETVSGFPFSGLAPQASSSPQGGSVVRWTTATHEGLAGWAVFREEVLPDGRIARTGPQIVPASAAAPESFRYAYLDPETRPATYYRYSVWAVTEDGLLAKAFSEILRTPE
jgi:hypothetical protein